MHANVTDTYLVRAFVAVVGAVAVSEAFDAHVVDFVAQQTERQTRIHAGRRTEPNEAYVITVTESTIIARRIVRRLIPEAGARSVAGIRVGADVVHSAGAGCALG